MTMNATSLNLVTKQIALILLLSLSSSTFSQNTFQKLIHNSVNTTGNIAQLSANGDLTFTSRVFDQFGSSGTDILMVSMNELGDTLWSKVYGGANDDRSFSLLGTSDGGYLIVGSTESFGIGNAVENVYLIKTDAFGDTLWSKAYGRSNFNKCYSAIECLEGGFLVVGVSDGGGMYMIKTNALGDLVWSKYYDRHDPPFFDSQLYAYCIVQEADSNFFVGGARQSPSGMFLSKIDPEGFVLWTKTTTEWGGIIQIDHTDDGELIILGATSLGLNNNDYLLIKSDLQGNTIWSKAYGSSQNDGASSGFLTADGGFAMVGGTLQGGPNSDVFFIKTDSVGGVQFSVTYGDSLWDAGRGIAQANDGGYFIVGWTQSFGFGSSLYLIKTDSTGSADCHQDSISTTVTNVTHNWSSMVLQSWSDPTNVYSGACQVTSGVNIEALCPVGINEDVLDERNMQLFPNPNHGRFTVEFNDPLSANSFYSVYDAMGLLLYQRPIPKGKEIEEIDLSRFGKGIYLLHFNLKDEVHTERVVVE